jgi:hypothetical protein
VLELVAAGKGNATIAHELVISLSRAQPRVEHLRQTAGLGPLSSNRQGRQAGLAAEPYRRPWPPDPNRSRRAVRHKGRATVVIARTWPNYGLGSFAG